MKRNMLVISLILALMLVACGQSADAPAEAAPADVSDVEAQIAEAVVEPTSIPTEEPTPVPPPPPTDMPTPEPTMTEEPVVVEAAGESWLLFSTSADGITIDSIYALSEDGSDLRQLVSNQQIMVPWDWRMTTSISPDGTRMAVITTSDPATLKDLWLNVINIPDGGITPITPLTSETTEPSGDPSIDDPNLQIARTMSEVNSLAWSPDSRYLAFVGAMLGRSSDLYLYDTLESNIAQITGEPSQAITPTFSPDGSHIVYAVVSSLGTGAGFGMESVSVVNVAARESRVLYVPDTGNEQWVGWLNNAGLVVYSWDVSCGNRSLRAVDINTGAVAAIWDDYFAAVDFDPATGTGLIAIDRLTESCSDDLSAGLFRVSLLSGIERAYDGEAYDVSWQASASRFMARVTEGQLVSVPLAGQTLPYDGPPYVRYDVSASGQDIAFAGMGYSGTPQGIFIGAMDGNYVLYSDQAFDYPQWAPDGSRLFAFGASGQLVMFAGPNYQPTEITTGITLSNWGPVWVTVE